VAIAKADGYKAKPTISTIIECLSGKYTPLNKPIKTQKNINPVNDVNS
jgi:hypothetical protein